MKARALVHCMPGRHALVYYPGLGWLRAADSGHQDGRVQVYRTRHLLGTFWWAIQMVVSMYSIGYAAEL